MRGLFLLRGRVRKLGGRFLRPDQELPGGEGPEEPTEPEGPEVEPPEAETGTPEHPIWLPDGKPGLPPGTVLPPLPPGITPLPDTLWVVAVIPYVGYRWVKISLKDLPSPPAGGIGGRPPDRPGGPVPPDREPKQ